MAYNYKTRYIEKLGADNKWRPMVNPERWKSPDIAEYHEPGTEFDPNTFAVMKKKRLESYLSEYAAAGKGKYRQVLVEYTASVKAVITTKYIVDVDQPDPITDKPSEKEVESEIIVDTEPDNISNYSSDDDEEKDNNENETVLDKIIHKEIDDDELDEEVDDGVEVEDNDDDSELDNLITVDDDDVEFEEDEDDDYLIDASQIISN